MTAKNVLEVLQVLRADVIRLSQHALLRKCCLELGTKTAGCNRLIIMTAITIPEVRIAQSSLADTGL